MAILRDTSSESGPKSDPVTLGQHKAVCIGIIDLGTHETDYGPKRKLSVVFEVPDDLMPIDENGQVVKKPKWISKKFVRSMHKKSSLRQALEMWRGQPFDQARLADEGFDIKKLLGVNANIFVSQKTSSKGRQYSVIDFIMPSTESIKPVHKLMYFDFDDNTPLTDEIKGFDREDIMTSPEWKSRQQAPPATAPPKSDVPWD